MRNLFKISLVALLGIVFSACQKEGLGDFSVSVSKAGPDYVEVFITAPYQMEMAYVITDEETLYTPTTLFQDAQLGKGGEIITVSPGQKIKLGSGLSENTKHTLFAAGRMSDGNPTRLIELSFTTKSFKFDEILTLMDTYEDGFKMHITVPKEVKNRNHAMCYGYGSLVVYNLAIAESRAPEELIEASVDLEAVFAGYYAGNYCLNDTTIVINDNNLIMYDEFGKPLEGAAGESTTVHDPYTPGEPIVFLTTEAFYGTPEDFNAVMGFTQPTENCYIPYFDRASFSFKGPFEKMTFRIDEPELCDATLDISYPEDKQGINDWSVRFNPVGDYFQYAYLVLPAGLYNQMTDTLLGGDESLWQWFLASYPILGMNICWPQYANEPLTVPVAQTFFREPLTGGETYVVLATLLGDEAGLTQRFYKEEFTTKEVTKPSPVIEVTALDMSESPYYAGFNIKAGADITGNVQKIEVAYWACEIAREWKKYTNAGFPMTDIIKSSNQVFTSEELEKINSPEGLDLYFPILDGETLRFAAYGCNDEYTFNRIDMDDNTAGWADCTTELYAVDKTPVSSPYFTSLLGDWTARATMSVQYVADDETIGTMEKTHLSKVTISDKAPELSPALDQSVYALYQGMDKTEVDGMYEELHLLTDKFTEYRIENQNRLLCTGFFDLDPMVTPNEPVSRLDYRSPYDLFVATDYSSVDIPQLIYDFGPKWFLEVLEDGSVIVPFNSMTIPPLTAWPGYPFYLGGVNAGASKVAAFYDSTEAIKGFPVEISADGNTITIKPIVIDASLASAYLPAGTYYMNAIGVQPMSTDVELIATIHTEIVLTRGWNGVSKSSVSNVRPMSVQPARLDGQTVDELPKAMRIRSLSKFDSSSLVHYKVAESPAVMTWEKYEAGLEELRKVKFNRCGYVK